jgi:hypothetical protein
MRGRTKTQISTTIQNVTPLNVDRRAKRIGGARDFL